MAATPFDTFKASFKGDLVTPHDPDYETAIARWAKNAARKAQVVAFVKDEADVALALKYAREARLEVAVRGGGHSASGGSSTEGGLVVDLSRYLNGVSIDEANKVAIVQGGAVWGTVDKLAIEKGLATVGGTVNHTGVGGLILGGGYGYLSGAHGLAIDNLVQATIVTAGGEILTVNEKENSELFWGIRGGGSNFGVVTVFHLRLHPQQKTVFAGMVIYPPNVLDQVKVAMEEVLFTDATDVAGVTITTRGPPPERHPCIVAVPFFNGSEKDGRERFRSLFAIPAIADMAKEIPFEELNALQNPVTVPGRNVYMKGTVSKAIGCHQELLNRVIKSGQDMPDIDVAIIHEYVPLAKINEIPIDATAFRSRGPFNNILVNIVWNETSDENTLYTKTLAHEIAAIIETEKPEPTGLEHAGGYGNYEAEEKIPQSRIEQLFAENYPRLQKLKSKYDPDLVFHKWFPIEPVH